MRAPGGAIAGALFQHRVWVEIATALPKPFAVVAVHAMRYEIGVELAERLARIGEVKVIGVPACALFFKTTSFDLLLPRLLAGVPITRIDLSRMGHGAYCLECKTCSFPKCPFGK